MKSFASMPLSASFGRSKSEISVANPSVVLCMATPPGTSAKTYIVPAFCFETAIWVLSALGTVCSN